MFRGGFAVSQTIIPEHRSTFLSLQPAPTPISSVDSGSGQSVEATLGVIANQTPDDMAAQSLPGLENIMPEKFHQYLSADLLLEDATSRLVDLGALPQLARSIIGSDVCD